MVAQPCVVVLYALVDINDHASRASVEASGFRAVDTRLTLKEMNPGEVLEVTTDYYPARQTIPSLMADLGYPCELLDSDKPVFRFVIEKTL